MIEKDTQSTSSVWFSKADIDARCAAAYDANKALFNSTSHNLRVTQAKTICKRHLESYERQYENCRGASRVRPANTEVKFENIYKPRNWANVKLALAAELAQMGITGNMLVIKNNLTRGFISVSVHVV